MHILINHIISSNNCGAPYPVKRNSQMPTWWEFIQWFLVYKVYNPHWTPTYTVCQPCSFNFNFILNFDNLEVRSIYLLYLIDPKLETIYLFTIPIRKRLLTGIVPVNNFLLSLCHRSVCLSVGW